MGRCTDCGAWNSLTEERIQKTAKGSSSTAETSRTFAVAAPLAQSEGDVKAERRPTGFSELDRVLGGGLVRGSLLLFGGEPGIGKSTLLLQLAAQLTDSGQGVLYVSSEESGAQVAARGRRLGLKSLDRLNFLSTTNLEEARTSVLDLKPELVILDSVQTLQDPALESPPGTVSQVRAVAHSFMELAKVHGRTILLVSHVTKDGVVAGPKLLEHMVDGVFYFELSSTGGYRMLRGQKNRFGPTHEVAVFEMGSKGLQEVSNPSERFLAERSKEMAGSSVVAHLEGSRAFLTEFQALVNRCPFGYPRRTVQGLDQNRVSVLMAVAEKQLDISFADRDVFCKVASGNRIEEPAADLAILFALVSAAYGRALPADLGLIGEVGLGGELRSVPAVNARLSELAMVGIKRAFVPQWNLKEAKEVRGIAVESVRSVVELSKKIFG